MAFVALFAAVLYIGWSILVAYRGDTPVEPAARVDGRTGQIEQGETMPDTAPGTAPEAVTPEATPVPGQAPQQDPSD